MSARKQSSSSSFFLLLLSTTIIFLIVFVFKTESSSFLLEKSAAGPTSPRFVSGPTIGYTRQANFTLNYYASATWITDVPADFITGYNKDASKLSSINPLNWINDWGAKSTWSGTYLNLQNSRLYQPSYGVKYYFRVAAKEKSGKIVISAPVTIYLPVQPTPAPLKPNCCGYNKALSKWYCYTNCTGANPNVTTLYPNQTCSVASTCHF